MKKSRTIYVPAGLSSIFQICYEGNRDLKFEGARGGGFRLKLGTKTYAELSEEDEVYINGVKVEAKTTLKAIDLMRKKFNLEQRFKIFHEIELPLGCGFGTSASGALGCVFAIADLANIKAGYCELTLIAHEADILALTGLGTVAGLASFNGSCGLIKEPGAPCIAKVKELEVDEEDVIVSLVFERIDKASVISSQDKKKSINDIAAELMEKIDEEGNAYALLKYSLEFATRCNFMDEELKRIAEYMLKIGFKGVAQNMIGRAVHGLIEKDKAERVAKELSRFGAQIVISELQEENPLKNYGYY